jgi:hypothetical protein
MFISKREAVVYSTHLSLVLSSKFLLALASTSVLDFGPLGTHDHIFVISRLSGVLNWGLLFDDRWGLTTTGHSPSTGE